MFHALFAVAGLVLLIWALVDAIQNPRLNGSERIAWVLVIILVPCLGAAIYFVFGRKRT